MTKRPLKNIAASVRQRLLNKSRSDVRPFQELVQYYAMERFLYRLSQSQHANRFILKGALLLQIWQTPEIRSTMDIDLLGRTNNDVSFLISSQQNKFNGLFSERNLNKNMFLLNSQILS